MTAIAARLTGIRFSYDSGAAWALDGIDLTIRSGEYVCLTGANGSGKTTLSRLLAGLSAPDAGQVELLGHPVFDSTGTGADAQQYRLARRGIGAVFQHPEDQIVTTVVEDDVAFGPENLGIDHADMARRIDRAIEAVDMQPHRHDDPTRMSGGQQQRVAIAGMLAMDPTMLVLDEPTAMLDPAARADVLDILDRLHAQGTTIIHVTHHDDEIMRAERVIRLESGRIAADERVAANHRQLQEPNDRAQRSDRPHSAAIRSADAVSDVSDVSEVSDAGFTPAIGDTPAIGTAPAIGETPAIEVRHLTYRRQEHLAPIINDFSMTVAAGETVAIMGRNGAGKTTLARLLCALERPERGSIRIDGITVAEMRRGRSRQLPRRRRDALRRVVGYVMQHPERQLFADTVAEDVAYGPRNQGLDADEVNARVKHALEPLGITHLAGRSPFSLSGGQQRLAAIAGVIACNPRVLVMDEPTAGLDAAAAARIHDLIATLNGRGVAVVMITHDRAEADLLANRIIMLGTPQTDAADAAAATTAAAAADSAQQPADAPADIAADAAAATTALPRRDRATPGGLIARLDPRVKMTTFLALMFTAFAIGSPAQLALGAALTAAIIAAGRLNPLRLLASVHMFLALFVMMGALNVFFVRTGDVLWHIGALPITTDGVATAALYTCRLALVIILGAVFLATTTPTAMTDAFGSLLSPLRRFGMHTQEVALVMSLALRFLPTLGAEVRSIVDAQSARGGGIETGSPMRRMRAMAAIIVPVFVGALRHADHLSLALDARCYEEGARRTHWRRLRVGGLDVAFIVIAVVYIVALIALAFI